MFPDAPTRRGRKHLATLMKLVESGVRAGILFSVQRPDARKIRPHHEMDPEFSQLLREAFEKGVNIFTQSLTYKQPQSAVVLKANYPRFSFI